MTSIIIDDEIKSHDILRNMLSKEHPEIEILASGENVSDGYELIKEHHPELVFLDIEMPDGTGFDLLQKIGHPNFQVIFITAFNQYAITAIKFGALDYLLKPFSKEELAHSIQVANERRVEYLCLDQLEILCETLRNLQKQKPPTRIAISTSEGIHYKLVKDIVRLEAHQNYTKFVLKDHDLNGSKSIHKILASLNLKKYEEQFELYPEFMRVHRSHLVNLKRVDKYVRGDGGYLVMRDGTCVCVSGVCKEELLGRLEVL